MEQGQTFRSTPPRYPTDDPNDRIPRRERSRFTHYYFYIDDEALGPMSMRVASFFPFQATYYLNGYNFIEQHYPHFAEPSVRTIYQRIRSLKTRLTGADPATEAVHENSQ